MKFQSAVLSILLSATWLSSNAIHAQFINCPEDGTTLCDGTIDVEAGIPLSLICGEADACTANSPMITGFGGGVDGDETGDIVSCNSALSCNGFTLTGNGNGDIFCQATQACFDAAFNDVNFVFCQSDNACPGLQVSNGQVSCANEAGACKDTLAIKSTMGCSDVAGVCDGAIVLDGSLRCFDANTCDGAVQICREGSSDSDSIAVNCDAAIPANHDICRVCLEDDSCGTLRTTPGTLGNCAAEDLMAMCTALEDTTNTNTVDLIFVNENDSCFAPCQDGMPEVSCTLAPSLAPSTSTAPSNAPSTSVAPSNTPSTSAKPSNAPSTSAAPSSSPSASFVPTMSMGKKGGMSMLVDPDEIDRTRLSSELGIGGSTKKRLGKLASGNTNGNALMTGKKGSLSVAADGKKGGSRL